MRERVHLRRRVPTLAESWEISAVDSPGMLRKRLTVEQNILYNFDTNPLGYQVMQQVQKETDAAARTIADVQEAETVDRS